MSLSVSPTNGTYLKDLREKSFRTRRPARFSQMVLRFMPPAKCPSLSGPPSSPISAVLDMEGGSTLGMPCPTLIAHRKLSWGWNGIARWISGLWGLWFVVLISSLIQQVLITSHHQIWHLFEGGRLFYNEENHLMEDEQHLAQMVALMGPPPKHFLSRSPKCSQYWDEDG